MTRTRNSRKGPLSWCQAPTCTPDRPRWHSKLAARLRRVFHARHMTRQHSNLSPTTATDGDFDDFFNRCEAWRRHVLKMWSRFDDVDAEIAASMWKHWTDGVRDERRMFSLVCVDVRRFCRREARVSASEQRFGQMAAVRSLAPIDVLVDQIAREELVSKITIPDKARPWAEHRCGYRDSISDAERVAGYRWARRTRKVLAHA